MIVSFSVVVSLLSRSGSNTLLGVNLMLVLWETLILFVGVASLGLPTLNNPDSIRISFFKVYLVFICVTLSAVVDSRYYLNAGCDMRMLSFCLSGIGALSEYLVHFIDIKTGGENEKWPNADMSIPQRLGRILPRFVSGLLVTLTIEFVVRQVSNDLSAAPLTSTGQLIPFLSGTINICALLWSGIGIHRRFYV